MWVQRSSADIDLLVCVCVGGGVEGVTRITSYIHAHKYTHTHTHTHTHTSTRAAGAKFKAIVCDSRPLCEGVQLANSLAEAGVEVTLITDAQAGVWVGRADLVLFGADALTEDAAVNKVCNTHTS